MMNPVDLVEEEDASELVKRNYSFANVQKPEVGSRPPKKLKRSETERLFTRPNPTDHLWLSEFDNQAYQKSPEPSSVSNLEDKSSHSLSLTSLSSPIHEANKKPSSFDAQSATSSDRYVLCIYNRNPQNSPLSVF